MGANVKAPLPRLGYGTLVARNGREAVELARTHAGPILLALLDMGMPVMGGAEAFGLLREVRPGLKVIISSGYELDGAAQQLLDRGADGFLQKPFRMNELAALLREALKKG
jgi:two-component system, cell cycle sensor histidine kinase and response regulator CckA